MKRKRKSKSTRLEYVGDLTFDAKPFDLASLPDNDRAARDAAAIMPTIRMAAVMTHDSDKALEHRLRESGDLNAG